MEGMRLCLVLSVALACPAGAWPLRMPVPPEMRAVRWSELAIHRGRSISLREAHTALSPAERGELARRLREMRVEDVDLDHLTGPSPGAIAAYHGELMHGERKKLLLQDTAHPERWRAQLAGPIATAPVELVLLTESAAIQAAGLPQPKIVAEPGAFLMQTHLIDLPPYALANSVRWARALNAGGALIDRVVADGYEPVVFDGRALANFLDHSVRRGDELVPVRAPVYMGSEPAMHSEIVLALYAKGALEPAAAAKWFMSAPQAGEAALAFRAAVEARPEWTGYRVAHVWAGAEAAKRFLGEAARVTRAVQLVQERYRFPMDAYGVLGVCNDTTAMVEVALSGGTARPTAWPLARDARFDMYLAR